MTSAPAIQVAGVRKSFDLDHEVPVRALRGVDLTVESGEFVALTGPSGCGKSTLIHVLAGMEVPEDGAVNVDGTDLFASSSDERARFRRRSVGLVFQEVHLLDGMTVAANVGLPALVAGSERSSVDRRARDTLALVGVSSHADRSPNGLSGGERQRVAVARALVNEPAILLADEPTGSLDTAGRDEIIELFIRLNQRGQTLLLVTHDPTVAAAAGRVIEMVDGRIDTTPGSGSGAG
ncbi:MAG: ABC transporter ATP-binding protein [Acidimicrobiales bacterium]